MLKGIVLADQYPLSFSSIQSLLDDGRTIVNRYSALFVAPTCADSIVGHDDYLTVLKGVQADIDRREVLLQEQIAGLTLNGSDPVVKK